MICLVFRTLESLLFPTAGRQGLLHETAGGGPIRLHRLQLTGSCQPNARVARTLSNVPMGGQRAKRKKSISPCARIGLLNRLAGTCRPGLQNRPSCAPGGACERFACPRRPFFIWFLEFQLKFTLLTCHMERSRIPRIRPFWKEILTCCRSSASRAAKAQCDASVPQAAPGICKGRRATPPTAMD